MNFPPFLCVEHGLNVCVLYLSPSSLQVLRQGHYTVDKFFVNQLSFCCCFSSSTQRDKERKKMFGRVGGFYYSFPIVTIPRNPSTVK